MTYLMIQNVGEAPIQSFTVLGLSTAKGNGDKIGQFGSGSKHSVNLLMRNNITPRIFLGDAELEFYSRDEKMGDRPYKQVYYKFNGSENPTGFALEYGELDWNNTNMALRELVSNAIDAVGHENVVLDLTTEPIPYKGCTTVYVPANDSIKQYYKDIRNYFLHFTGRDKITILSKNEISPVRVYRKGVFVLELKNPSIFDYNFGDDIKIDESRNMSDYTVRAAAGKVLGKNTKMLEKVIKHFVESNTAVWESNFSGYDIGSIAVVEAWESLYGNALVCDNEKIAELARSKGHKVIVPKQGYNLLSDYIQTALSVIGQADQNGWVISKPSAEMTKTFNKVWTKLQNSGFTMNKPKPKLMAFTEPMINGKRTLGFYEPKEQTVYIGVDFEGIYSVHVEELAHYITGAADGDRAFQQFAFDLAARWGF